MIPIGEELADGDPYFDKDGQEFEDVDMELVGVNVGLLEVMRIVPSHG